MHGLLTSQAYPSKERRADIITADPHIAPVATNSPPAGNRCGHDPARLRDCNAQEAKRPGGATTKRRGKGGKPPILGIIAAAIGHAARSGRRLVAWSRMNETGRRRRSEAREAMQSLMQYLIFEEFQIESRRCARVDADGDLVAPDLRLVARQLSESSTDWHGAPLSYWRVLRILRQFEKVGYIKRTEQYRYQAAHGGWCASTRAITFTKLFFLELGGQSLWNQVLEAGREKTRAAAVRFVAAGRNARDAVAGLFRFTRIFSPWMTKSKPPPSTN